MRFWCGLHAINCMLFLRLYVCEKVRVIAHVVIGEMTWFMCVFCVVGLYIIFCVDMSKKEILFGSCYCWKLVDYWRVCKVMKVCVVCALVCV